MTWCVINNIDSSKAYQKDNIPPSILKANVDIIAKVLHNDINLNIENGSFPVNLKNADVTPIFKKLIIGESVSYLGYQRYMKKYFINKYMNTNIGIFRKHYLGYQRYMKKYFINKYMNISWIFFQNI